jgi:hypothetical protein
MATKIFITVFEAGSQSGDGGPGFSPMLPRINAANRRSSFSLRASMRAGTAFFPNFSRASAAYSQTFPSFSLRVLIRAGTAFSAFSPIFPRQNAAFHIFLAPGGGDSEEHPEKTYGQESGRLFVSCYLLIFLRASLTAH